MCEGAVESSGQAQNDRPTPGEFAEAQERRSEPISLRRNVDLDANRLSDPAYAEKLEWMWTLNRSLTNTMIVEDTETL